MEPQDVNSTQQTVPVNSAIPQSASQSVQTAEVPKLVPEEPPVVLLWKRPIITMLIIGGVAILIMLLAKNL